MVLFTAGRKDYAPPPAVHCSTGSTVSPMSLVSLSVSDRLLCVALPLLDPSITRAQLPRSRI